MFLYYPEGNRETIDLSELENLTRAGRRVMGLDEGDEISR